MKTTELVSVEWLKANLENPNLILLDTSLPRASEVKKTILGARFFDLKGKFSNQESVFPNTFPLAAQFELESRRLGINKNSHIVVFDDMGIYWGPRVWFMFKAMGHEKVSVLDGGLPEWLNQGLPVTTPEKENYPQGNFNANFNKQLVKHYEDILSNLENPSFTVVDARSKGRFDGTEKEPRKHLKSGHIKDSVNIPFKNVLDDNRFKPVKELQNIFDENRLKNEELVFSCGSGITACILAFAHKLARNKISAVYDGSWTEWAELQNLKEPPEQI